MNQRAEHFSVVAGDDVQMSAFGATSGALAALCTHAEPFDVMLVDPCTRARLPLLLPRWQAPRAAHPPASHPPPHPVARTPTPGRSSGRRPSQTPANLVDFLARRIVNRAPERSHVMSDVRDEQEARVAAGHQQRQCRLGQWTVLDDVDRDVGREVVAAIARFAQCHRQRLGRRAPPQTGATPSRTALDRARGQHLTPHAAPPGAPRAPAESGPASGRA